MQLEDSGSVKNFQTADFKCLSVANEQQLAHWLRSHEGKAMVESNSRYEEVQLSTSAGTWIVSLFKFLLGKNYPAWAMADY